MERKIKTLLFFKIYAFVFLSWICHFYIYMSKQNKYLVECYNHHRKIYARNYRLLAKYKQDNDSIIVCLEEEIPNRVNDKKNISNSEKLVSGEKKQSNGSFPINVRGHKKNIKNKSWIFETKQYSHMEKKIFKELDYIDFLKNNRTISNNTYKKIIYKKYGLRFALPIFLLLVLSISFVLDNFWGYGMFDGLFRLIITYSGPEWMRGFTSKLWNSHFRWLFVGPNALSKSSGTRSTLYINGNMVAESFCGFFIYFVPFIILGIILILRVVYYHKKVKKYEKIKFTKR
ncbi:fam-l protein [Plasmodium malariae]|uniref:Fam-l protein n=1 Tax=Plasmodium malariae TaxID=5858 RepID=A0A1D3JH16_PLAMA|nr:fam-l protein [Plasmodium malariae]SBT85580.1 fam-l protein [Plasmodium malariae]